uniref:Putative replicase n=1 Tax=Letsystermes virus TaxID=2796608 RepID=A0A894KLL6_9VIRU|nr:putative replicase [Letsystermes virus]
MASEAGAKGVKLPVVEVSGREHRVKKGHRKTVDTVMKWLLTHNLIADFRAYDRTRKWLLREANGSNEDLRTPFFLVSRGAGKSWEPREKTVLRFWDVFNKAVAKSGLSLDEQELISQFEHEQSESISPQSPYLDWDSDGPEKVAEIWADKQRSSSVQSKALGRAVERLRSLIPVGSIRMTSIEDAIGAGDPGDSWSSDGMDITTSSGLPFNKGPWKPRASQRGEDRLDSERAYAFIIKRTEFLIKEWRAGKSVILYAMVGKRLAQKTDIRKRKRIIIAIEKAEPVAAKTFTPELLRELTKVVPQGWDVSPFVALTDLPNIDLAMQTVLSRATRENRAVLSGDYSGYDRSLQPWFIELAGSVLSSWIYRGDWVNYMVHSMVNNVTLVTPNKVWVPKASSMKSGSGLTNLLDSLCNLLVLFYGEEAGYWVIANAAVQGDDFIVDADGITPEKMFTVAAHFGLEANPEKQMYIPNALRFLQRTHLRGRLGGIASAFRTLGSLLSYERLQFTPEDWNGSSDIIRARAQLENVAFNPVFEDMVEFIAAADKFKLGEGKSAAELLKEAANAEVAMQLIRRPSGAQSLMIDESIHATDSFENSVVSGVLNGEQLPPLGSEARFSRVYGLRAVAARRNVG